MSDSLTPSGVFSVVRDAVADAIGPIKDSLLEQRAATTKIFNKLDTLLDKHHEHDIEDERRFAAIDQRLAVTDSKAEEAKGAGKPAWLAITITAITAAGSAVVAFLTKGGKA